MHDATIIAAHENFSEILSRHILQQATDQLPDLSRFHIIIPNAQAARQLKLALSIEHNNCLLAPFIGSLSQWMNEHEVLANPHTAIINQQAKKLLLLEALKQHPSSV